MSLVVTVTRPEPCSDPLLPFKELDDKKALRIFKRGAILHSRTDSALHGCWLTHKGEIQDLRPNSEVSQALLELAEPCGTKVVEQGSFSVTVQLWSFAPEKLAKRTERWRRAKRCAKDWERRRGQPSAELAGLSDKALATLRYLKRQYAMCMHPELFDVWLELNGRGLVDVNPNGGVHLRPEAAELHIPFGDILKLQPVEPTNGLVQMDEPVHVVPPILLDVRTPHACSDYLGKFAVEPRKTVLDAFKAGAVLHVRRGTTPRTWWLEHKDGRTHYFGRDVATARDLVHLGKLTSSSGLIPRAPTFEHRDGGLPLEQTWEYCLQRRAICALEWASAKECADDWNNTAGAFSDDARNLSDLAKATLRTLQQKYTLPMYPELFDVWIELNSKGYLQVFAEGYAQLVDAARAVFVEVGPRLEVQHPKPGQG